MFLTLWGMLETYGARNLAGQAWEKLILDPKRYARVHGLDCAAALPGKAIPSNKNYTPQTIFLLCHCYLPDSNGGTERFAENLASAIREAGCRVYILAYSARVHTAYPSQISGILYTEEVVNSIPVIRFRHCRAPAGILKDFVADDSEMEAFAAFLFQKYRPDLVHFLHLSRVNAFAAACQSQNIPYAITLTDFFAVCHFYTRVDRTGCFCTGSEQGRRCKRVCPVGRVKSPEARYQNAAALLRGAVWLAAPSSYAAEVILREFPGVEIAVVPHGIKGACCGRKRSGPVRRFAFVGKLAAIKGAAALIQVFHRVPEDCSLHIYGEGASPYVQRLRRLAKKDDRIIFHGSKPSGQINEVYQQADCVVIPSVVPESYNFVIREALQSGCLVVATKLGAMPEAVVEHENGFLFSCGNLEEMYQAIMRAYDFKWQAYRQASFQEVRQEADTYRLLYGQAVSERNGSHE